MADSIWHYAQNQFDTSTRSNFKKMNKLSADHDSKLSGAASDPQIAALYNFYHPIHLQYKSRYQHWLTMKAVHQSTTRAFENKMKNLTDDFIENIDIRIQIKYRRNSPEYTALLPNYRAPFQTGGYEDRLAALGSLFEAIENYPDLSDVKEDVERFYLEADELRIKQQSKEISVSQASNQLEEARVEAAEGMYYVLGGLLQKYYKIPEQIEQYYDLELIRRTGQSELEIIKEGAVGAGTTETVIQGMFNSEGNVMLMNNGSSPLIFCDTDSAGTACETGISLQPGESVIQENLNIAAGRFFNVTNTGTVSGSYQVIAM